MTRKKKNAEPKVHNDLQGFNVQINEFGEIKEAFDVDKINDFLNKNLDDIKFKKEE